MIYPLSSAIILTDAIFEAYGGATGTSTPAQRNAAYFIAEEELSNHLGTLLLPITMTGTVHPLSNGMTYLDWCYVHNISQLLITDSEDVIVSTVPHGWTLQDGDMGIVRLKSALAQYLGFCVENPGEVYNLAMTYTAGLPTGTANRPNVLNALTIMADIALKEIIDPAANESTGDIGVQQFSANGYSETRVQLARTALGTSARAMAARKLVMGLKIHRGLSLR